MIKPVDNQAMTGKASRRASSTALSIIWLIWAIGVVAMFQAISMAMGWSDGFVIAFQVTANVTLICAPIVGGFVALSTGRPWTATLFGLVLCAGLFLGALIGFLPTPETFGHTTSTPTWSPSNYCVKRSGGYTDCPGG
ncbi:hypothetical protein [Microtetraspora glauca]|uniref:MFS transporter n=1 Tax=Microtetraspora glauca TaxID=1996 RepID=A0ABV3GTX6_MICGL